MKRGKLHLVLLGLILCGFVLGLIQLFQIRFKTGDVYPAYSSLRADPLGARAFYQSLEELLSARRNFQPFSRLQSGRDHTLFYLGAGVDDLKLLPAEVRDLERFLSDGGRLVIALFPIQNPSRPGVTAVARTNAPAGKKTKRSGPGDEHESMRPVALTAQWGFNLNRSMLPKDSRGQTVSSTEAYLEEDLQLPQVISCHTSTVFQKMDPAWRVIYARGTNGAVIIDRQFGKGSIVVLADSYHFSNEAMLKEREASLLSWLMGPSTHAVFDETHLGVQDSSGIAMLARKYRLHGLVLGLLVLGALYVWQNMVTLVPFRAQEGAEADQAEHIAGRESTAGFINLLRRNVRGHDLLGICIAEWQKSCARQTPRKRLEQIQLIIDMENSAPATEVNPVRTYQKIRQILIERKS